MDQWIEVVGRAWVCQLDDLECCLGSPLLKWLVGVVFVATNQKLAVGEVCWRRPVRRHVILPLGSEAGRPLEASSSCGTGQSGVTPDSPVPPLTAALTSAAITVPHCSYQSRPLRADSRCSAGAPDSPVAHWTVRWIIAELRLGNTKVKSLSWFTLVHRTVWCARPGQPSVSFCSFLLKPNLFFWLVCVEPLMPVECII
jgi:hypothetical protein